MEYELRISGRLPGMNEFIAAQRTNKYKGAKLKKDAQKICEFAVQNQLKGVHITKPVRIHYFWFERNMRRDRDNISGFGHKVIQDALVKCGVIKNDGWREIESYTDTFAVDKDNPHISLLIEEVD